MTAPYHHGRLREALLARAEQTLREVGIDGLSLRQLARDLGVSHGAPARHFRDKQALLDALALHGFEELDAVMRAAATAAGSYRDRLAAVAAGYIGFATERAELLQLMYATKHHPAASEELLASGEAAMGVVFELLTEAQAAGEVRIQDTALLAQALFASVHGIAVLAAGDLLNAVPVDVVLEQTLDLLWRGMSTRR